MEKHYIDFYVGRGKRERQRLLEKISARHRELRNADKLRKISRAARIEGRAGTINYDTNYDFLFQPEKLLIPNNEPVIPYSRSGFGDEGVPSCRLLGTASELEVLESLEALAAAENDDELYGLIGDTPNDIL